MATGTAGARRCKKHETIFIACRARSRFCKLESMLEPPGEKKGERDGNDLFAFRID